MKEHEYTALVTASTVNLLLEGSLKGKADLYQIPSKDDPQTGINVELSPKDFSGVVEEVLATPVDRRLHEGSYFSYLDLWITSEKCVNEEFWYGDEGLVLVSAWMDEAI